MSKKDLYVKVHSSFIHNNNNNKKPTLKNNPNVHSVAGLTNGTLFIKYNKMEQTTDTQDNMNESQKHDAE